MRFPELDEEVSGQWPTPVERGGTSSELLTILKVWFVKPACGDVLASAGMALRDILVAFSDEPARADPRLFNLYERIAQGSA
jgi:hypothetical protein